MDILTHFQPPFPSVGSWCVCTHVIDRIEHGMQCATDCKLPDTPRAFGMCTHHALPAVFRVATVSVSMPLGRKLQVWCVSVHL